MQNPWLMAVIIAFSFALWPIVVSYFKVPGGYASMIVMSATAAATIFFGRKDFSGNLPSSQALLLLGASGLLNGWGAYKYAEIANFMGSRTGAFVAAVAIALTIAGSIYSAIFLKYVPSIRVVAGLSLGAVSIWLIATGTAK